MNEITTASGKSYMCDYFNQYAPASQVNINILGATLVEIATTFGNPAETALLTYGNQTLVGYTKLFAIIPDANWIRVVLGKE